MTANPADLDLVAASAALGDGSLSATELLDACLARIAALDGPGTHDGAPDLVNAWVRVYEDDARAAARRADERFAAARSGGGEEPGVLCGIPVGLKDLYAVAGKPLTASSRVADLAPDEDCVVWANLAARGMVLVGHLHTHEWAAGGSTDQVGNPWALDRTAGGSSGGSAAALAARMVPAATGSDTAGSLRIPSALCGTSTIKPTRGRVSLQGVIPLSESLDHAGPMCRTLADCRVLLAGMLGEGDPVPADPGALRGARIAVSPRVERFDIEAECVAGLDAALAALRAAGAEIVAVEPPPTVLEVPGVFFEALAAEMLAYHRRFDDRRDDYRGSTRGLLGIAEARAMTAQQLDDAFAQGATTTDAWAGWFDEHRLDAIIEPTEPFVAPVRGTGYDAWPEPMTTTDGIVIPDPFVALTYLWDWTGFPVAALPAGLGATSGLPVGVSLIGPTGADDRVAALGVALQTKLGVPVAPLTVEG